MKTKPKRSAENKSTLEITPLVLSLSGIIKLHDRYNHKKEYGKFLSEKYK
jgi:hypothetical protein